MAKHLNLELFIPVSDYFKTTEWYDRNWDITLPFFFSLLLFLFVFNRPDTTNGFMLIPNIDISTIIGILSSFMQSTAIIFSFSMASVTIFITSSNKNIDEIRNLKWGSSGYTLYQRVLAGYTYTLIVSSFATFLNIFLYLLIAPEKLSEQTLIIMLTLSTFLLIHVLFISIRNMTVLYHILWKPNSKPRDPR